MRPLGRLLMVMAIGAAFLGTMGYMLGRLDLVQLVEPMRSRIPAAEHAAFLGVLWAHLASYGIGIVGGTMVIIRTWRSRSPSGP